MKIDNNVLQLSIEGCKSILSDLRHVSLVSFNDCNDSEVLTLMREVIQLNLNDGLLDEIEILLVLKGE